MELFFNAGGKQVKAVPENTGLYLFNKKYAEVDHIFVRDRDEVGHTVGYFIFRNDLPTFEPVVNAIIREGLTPIQFMPQPIESDWDQYLRSQSSDIK
jgi:hypothetical protein